MNMWKVYNLFANPSDSKGLHSKRNLLSWEIQKRKDDSYQLLSTLRRKDSWPTGGITLDLKVGGNLFASTQSTCASTAMERPNRPLFVAYSVLEETKYDKVGSNSQFSSSHKLEEYNASRNDGIGVRKSIYKEFIRPVGQQLSVGTFLGLATGYSLRRIGRVALFLLGMEVLVLQWMAYKGWVTVHWNKLSRDLIPVLDKSAAETILDILLYKMPFTAAFCAGLKLAP